MKKVKKKHQKTKASPSLPKQHSDLEQPTNQQETEVVPTQQTQEHKPKHAAKNSEDKPLEPIDQQPKIDEREILDSILNQENQYEVHSTEKELDELDEMLDAYGQMDAHRQTNESNKPKYRRLHHKENGEKLTFREHLDNIRYTIESWSQYPIFTTFAGRFTIISLLSCSGFALLLTVLLAGCHQDFELTNQTFVMELGTDIYANPALYINQPEQIDVSKLNVEPNTPGVTILENRFVSVSLDYLGVGTYDFVMKEGIEETPFVIKVKDTQPPTLQATPSEVTVEWGQQPDWQELYGGTDLSGVYYETNQNIWTEAGQHDVEVKIRDRFGNSLVRSLKVTVKP